MDPLLTSSLTYLTLSLGLLAAFYMWRFTVWAANAGGYWNLVTGKRAAQNINPNVNTNGGVAGMGSDAMIKSAASAARAAGSQASKAAAKGGKVSLYLLPLESAY